MKRFILFSVVFLVSLSLFAADKDSKNKAASVFEKFKALEGEWQARGEDGKTKHLAYDIVANGSCVQETFTMEGQDDHTMVTMYHLDGEHLMLTHYCMANNQPRMRAESISDDLQEVTFEFFDATNLSSPDEGHMYRAVFHFNGEDEFENAWTFRKNGEDTFTESDIYTRLK